MSTTAHSDQHGYKLYGKSSAPGRVAGAPPEEALTPLLSQTESSQDTDPTDKHHRISNSATQEARLILDCGVETSMVLSL